METEAEEGNESKEEKTVTPLSLSSLLPPMQPPLSPPTPDGGGRGSGGGRDGGGGRREGGGGGVSSASKLPTRGPGRPPKKRWLSGHNDSILMGGEVLCVCVRVCVCACVCVGVCGGVRVCV